MELLDDIKDLLHQDGRQPHGGLIQHQKLGLAHQRPADGQHLLLAAAEGAGHLAAPLLQAGEALVDVLNALRRVGAGLGERPHLQVLLHCHLQKDPPPLRALGQPMLNDLVGRNALQVLSVKHDGAAAGMEQAGNCIQYRGLAGAVGADQGDDLPLVDLKRDALDSVDAAVVDMDILYLQQCHFTPPSAYPGKPPPPRDWPGSPPGSPWR